MSDRSECAACYERLCARCGEEVLGPHAYDRGRWDMFCDAVAFISGEAEGCDSWVIAAMVRGLASRFERKFGTGKGGET